MLSPTDIERCLPTTGLMPEAGEEASFNNVRVVPLAGRVHTYSAVFPAGWHLHADTSSRDRGRLSDDHFSTLGIFSPAPRVSPPVLVSFGMTVAPEGSTVAGCYAAYCRQAGYEILSVRPVRFMAGYVVDGLVSTTPPGGSQMLIRLAMFEDQLRLFGLAAMAPAALFPRFARELGLALTTFELAWSSGGSLPLA